MKKGEHKDLSISLKKMIDTYVQEQNKESLRIFFGSVRDLQLAQRMFPNLSEKEIRKLYEKTK